jgi:GTP cyclohydrolase I
LLKTPERVAKAYDFLTQGYQQSAEDVLRGAIFDESYSEMVLVKDIEVYSLCEHHMLPFFGKAHIAYIPNGKIVGLSKLARCLDHYARRLQNQERITTQVAEQLMAELSPKGVAVVLQAEHLCMAMRGVCKHSTVTKTSKMLGAFKDDQKARAEFFGLIAR